MGDICYTLDEQNVYNKHFDATADKLAVQLATAGISTDIYTKLQLTVPSLSRDVSVYPDTNHFSVRFSPALKSIKMIQLMDNVMCRSDVSPLVGRSMTACLWIEESEEWSSVVSVVVDRTVPSNSVLAFLAGNLSNGLGVTVNFSSVNGFLAISVPSGRRVKFFPDFPVVNVENSSQANRSLANAEAWTYCAGSVMWQLGFSVSRGSVVVGGETFVCPGLMETQGPDYVFLHCKVNGSTPLGSVFEPSSDHMLVGPYLGKIYLTSGPLGTVFSPSNNSLPHQFDGEVDISSLEFSLMSPSMGRVTERYATYYREIMINLLLVQNPFGTRK